MILERSLKRSALIFATAGTSSRHRQPPRAIIFNFQL
jgi:hypothetical protein